MWIWKAGKITSEKAEFKKSFTLAKVTKQAILRATCDNEFILFINGKKIAASNDWQKPFEGNVAKHLKKGMNQISVKAVNEGTMAGFVLDLKINKGPHIGSDKSWQARAPQGKWHRAVELKPYGSAPWAYASS